MFEVPCLPSSKVDDLKEKLAAQEVELKQKNEDADLLIKKVHTAVKQSTMVTCVCIIYVERIVIVGVCPVISDFLHYPLFHLVTLNIYGSPE